MSNFEAGSPQQRHQHRSERELTTARLTGQIAQIATGRVDLPPSRECGHRGRRILGPHHLAGFQLG